MANHYIREGAAGTDSGADWTNAFTDLPESLVRGDTYYVADGSYAGHVFEDATSGTDAITIQKATAASHGTETGWDSSYGDGQAVWETLIGATDDVWCVRSDYYIFDGAVGGGPGAWKSGHGFKVGKTGDYNGVNLGDKYGLHGGRVSVEELSFSRIEFSAERVAGSGHGLMATTYQESAKNVTVSRCWFHDIGGVILDLTGTINAGGDDWTIDGWTIEYCHFAGNASLASNHGVGIRLDYANNIIFRYNQMADMVGTGFIGKYTGDAHGNSIHVYGNVFYYTHGFDWTLWVDVGSFGQVVFVNSGQQDGDGWRIYNNSFVNLPRGTAVTLQGNGADNEVYNNLFYDIDATVTISGATAEGNNSDVASDPFTDWQNEDFTLATPTTAGTTLASPFDEDPNGSARGSAGVWDLGAYEFLTTVPSAPTNLTITAI